jgi:hypothetical protein
MHSAGTGKDSIRQAVAALAMETTIGLAFGFHMADAHSISTAVRTIYRGWTPGRHAKHYSTISQYGSTQNGSV